MPRRAFTLLELLVAIGLVLMLAGLSLPALWGRLDGSRIDLASRLVGAAVVAARAESQRSGAPIELVAVMTPDGDALVIREVRVQAAAPEASKGVAPDIHPWGVLPDGVRVSLRPPATAEEPGTPAAAPDGPRRIGVFVPDGSVVAKDPIYLCAGETALHVQLNRWTGGITATTHHAEADDESDELPPPPTVPSSEGGL
jgi:prepilin-type N-terminal cleavage/methylation domain-containing protein